jgi:hypothetical protein
MRRYFVKTTFFALTLLLAYAFVLSAQDATQQKPPMSIHNAGSSVPRTAFKSSASVTPPPLCNAICFFYAGDISPDDPNADAFSDENTLYILGSATYAPVNLPFQAALHGILFNIVSSDAFDPATANYDIRENVSEGNGGFSVQHGTARIQIVPTGRFPFGFPEYQISVHFPVVTLEPGVTYWFNVQPQCTNGATDGSCYFGRFYISNTTQGTNNIGGADQPAGELFLNSAFFGASWANWCDAEFSTTPAECGQASFGLMGTPN